MGATEDLINVKLAALEEKLTNRLNGLQGQINALKKKSPSTPAKRA